MCIRDRSTLALAVLTGLLAGLLLLVPLALTSGMLGLGTLTDIGPHVWAVSAAVAGWVALGCAAGYLTALAVAGHRDGTTTVPRSGDRASGLRDRPSPRRARD